MDANDPRTIVKTLAEGTNPITGEVFPPDSPYNHPGIIRALFRVCELAWPPGRTPMNPEERRRRNLDRGMPGNAGLPWSMEDRNAVAEGFKKGRSFQDLANEFERSTASIQAQLAQLGLIDPPKGDWFNSTGPRTPRQRTS